MVDTPFTSPDGEPSMLGLDEKNDEKEISYSSLSGYSNYICELNC